VREALFKNTLVSLPTGLGAFCFFCIYALRPTPPGLADGSTSLPTTAGKTFVAAVVMYNYWRWFPRGKIIFMAPTKPLVVQQVESCYGVRPSIHPSTDPSSLFLCFHSSTHSFIHSFTHSFTHSFIYSFIHPSLV
jgi:hypothetical protein